MGWFNPVLKENEEMMYQFDFDYRFDSGKIARAFGLEATPYRTGIATTLEQNAAGAAEAGQAPAAGQEAFPAHRDHRRGKSSST
jgi:hypothetical protein